MSGWRERPNAPAAGAVLCEAADVPPDDGLERVFGDGPDAFRVVVFRVGDALRAYVNECPHVHVPFHFAEGVFCVHDREGRRDLMCPHHAAMFRLDDGYCHEGPCRGRGLIRVDLEVDAGMVRVA